MTDYILVIGEKSRSGKQIAKQYPQVSHVGLDHYRPSTKVPIIVGGDGTIHQFVNKFPQVVPILYGAGRSNDSCKGHGLNYTLDDILTAKKLVQKQIPGLRVGNTTVVYAITGGIALQMAKDLKYASKMGELAYTWEVVKYALTKPGPFEFFCITTINEYAGTVKNLLINNKPTYVRIKAKTGIQLLHQLTRSALGKRFSNATYTNDLPASISELGHIQEVVVGGEILEVRPSDRIEKAYITVKIPKN